MFESTRHADESLSADKRSGLQSASLQTRWLAIIGLVIQACLLGYVSGTRLFSVVIALLAIVAAVNPWRINLRKSLHLWLYAFIAIGFALYHFVSPIQISIEDPLFYPTQSHILARILMSIQLVALFLRNEKDRPPLWLAGMGALCLPFAVNLPLGYTDHHTILIGITAYICVLALFGNTWRMRTVSTSRYQQWSRAVILSITLTTSLLLGAGSALALQRYEKKIEFFLEDYLGFGPRSVRPGFTIGNRLNDVSHWKTTLANEIALRAISDKPPGYLRGVVFDTYNVPRHWNQSWMVWSNEDESSPLRKTKPPYGLPGLKNDGLLFSVIEQPQGPFSTIDLWQKDRRGLFIFAPLETAYVSVDNGSILRESHGTLRASLGERQTTYTLITTGSLPPILLDERLRQRTTSIDTMLSPRITQLADELFHECKTNSEKIAQVQRWFHDHFEYRLGIDIPRGEDPLTYFLTTKSPAHCEFFATGTAVLLRLAEVPTRYVVGYVATERNDVGGYWVARNKDAHAWVEAYDDSKQQWVIVESTPAAGIPQPRTASSWSQTLDTFRLYWARLQSLFRNLRVGRSFQKLWDHIWSIPGLVTISLVLVSPFLWRNRRLPHWTRRRDDSHLKSMHAVLTKLDRHAKHKNCERQADETLLQFSSRIRAGGDDPNWSHSLADCYDLYTTLRFRSQTGPDAIVQLENALAQVPTRLPSDDEHQTIT